MSFIKSTDSRAVLIDKASVLFTEEEQKKIYEALKAKFALGHPYDNTPHTYCEECDCCITCDCCVCDGEGGQLL